MRFLRADEYLKVLLATIPQASMRVVIHAMDIGWGKAPEQLLPLLCAAAQRGVEVRLVGDIYTRFNARSHRRRPPGASWVRILEIQKQLQTAGAEVTYIGKLGLNPFAGRTHSKITLVDNTVYTFGGVNFTDDSFQNADYMLSMTDPILADRLYRLVRHIEKDQLTLPDLEEDLGGQATLLFDGGTPKQSIIYETACALVKRAKKVYYVSQMCPSGTLAKNLVATDNECYFIKARQADIPANLALMFDQRRYGITNRYQGSRYIHAKFILTEDKNGSKHIVSGSNNFSWRGVAYGTKEIAVHSTDPQLWDSFYNFLQTEIKQ